MPRLYTRKGDDGVTGVLGPGRVSKDDPRVEAMGAVDELNATLGVALAAQRDPLVRTALLKIQDDLFTIGAELAAVRGAKGKLPRTTPEYIARLERVIEDLDTGQVKEFLLPRGSEALARLHWTRTVARRAERRVVAFARSKPLNPEVLRYLNRLSSALYQMALWVQLKERERPEHPSYRE